MSERRVPQPRRRKQSWWARSGWNNPRDLACWLVGAGIAVVAFVRTGRIDYTLYVPIGTFVGLPFVLRSEDGKPGSP